MNSGTRVSHHFRENNRFGNEDGIRRWSTFCGATTALPSILAPIRGTHEVGPQTSRRPPPSGCWLPAPRAQPGALTVTPPRTPSGLHALPQRPSRASRLPEPRPGSSSPVGAPPTSAKRSRPPGPISAALGAGLQLTTADAGCWLRPGSKRIRRRPGGATRRRRCRQRISRRGMTRQVRRSTAQRGKLDGTARGRRVEAGRGELWSWAGSWSAQAPRASGPRHPAPSARPCYAPPIG